MTPPLGEWVLLTTHYDILGLPRPPALLRQPDLKAAYHRALLKHHPDKSGSSTPSEDTSSGRTATPVAKSGFQAPRTFTVDQVTMAYKVLSNPRAKAEYDRSLLCLASGAGGQHAVDSESQPFRTGLEVFDLDDMEVGEESEGAGFWYRGCRCGDKRGFLVHEEDLENEMERGEIMVGCQGCSLWAKVLFAVEEEDVPDAGNDENCVDGKS
ncbi:diphthamide biosynthesis protein 4 [Coccidioides immitis RMSCC 3703]|uniref:Diphthamide biosynthesis protein 4 n=1 Tax=Coccidioides immitis RMSCC 3703 TaxID=454286 RepID=A0A0J8QMZ0_COCIT|nr:diphthamide biosynthesis protein 4 [Coccidioides immitis RMSCC 3703]